MFKVMIGTESKLETDFETEHRGAAWARFAFLVYEDDATTCCDVILMERKSGGKWYVLDSSEK